MISQIKENVYRISTIDVFKNPNSKDEASRIDMDGLEAYGANRYRLEFMVREYYPDATIVRLPGLFGRGIKKNFIYDFMTLIPSMLKYEKFEEFSLSMKNCFNIKENKMKYELSIENFKRLNNSIGTITSSSLPYESFNTARLLIILSI